MGKKSVIIIGAGLAGLSAGCYAQMNGYQSHIFEHHSKPGGVAAAWKRNGYLIDGGIHFLMGHRPGQPIYRLYQELGTAQDNHFIDMTTYGRFIDEVSGYSLDATIDLDRFAADLKTLSPADAPLIDDLIAGVRKMRDSGALLDVNMANPPEIMDLLDQFKMFWSMRRFWRYLSGRYAKPVAEYVRAVQHPLLRQIIENLFMPEVPVWFVMMCLALLADRQMGLIEGGCRDFIQSIEARFKSLGGQVAYKATVEEILVEDDRAVGVRLADGSEHRADIVVSAADGYGTIFKMLGGRYIDQKTEERYRDWKLIRPVVMISYGVSREFKDSPSLSVILLKDPLAVGGQSIKVFSLRVFNYSPKFASPGKTVIQAMFETEWDFWDELRKDRSSYEAEKDRLAREILVRLEAYYPGIASQVDVTDVATPFTTWRYTLNWKGAYMGWLPGPKEIMTSIPRTLPGLRNFYLAGQWILPGGGVPPCLYSGRHVVQILCHQDRKPFVTSVP